MGHSRLEKYHEIKLGHNQMCTTNIGTCCERLSEQGQTETFVTSTCLVIDDDDGTGVQSEKWS